MVILNTPSAESANDGQPLLVCLLPARNAEHDLPEYLASVSTYCDAIVALDDGSTDRTYDILAAHPLVRVLLRNPVRQDYRGWDDAANRNQLLAAAELLHPQWLISLDADERIDQRDAASLREFLQTDALPGFAYGFRHVPMWMDGEHFLPTYEWVYRVFSAGPGQRFPSLKLHFVPIPGSIPRHLWIRTTLRIQHLGGLTPEHRLNHFHKYLEADPLRIYQTDYADMLDLPGLEETRRWQARPLSVPVLLDGTFDADTVREANSPAVPALSAIVISRNNEATIASTVASVVDQDVPEPFEVIVVASGSDRTAAIVREQFPAVTVIELARPALPGEARNAGLAVARGSFVTFPGSHIELLPGSLAARLRAHRRGYAMVAGVVTNGTPTPAGWASYFLDHAEGLPGHGAAEFDGPPGNCSYARLPLLEVGGFPEGVRTAEDTAVNIALVRRGYVACRDPGVRFVHRSRCTTVPRLLRHHFQRGRGLGRLLLERHRKQGHLLHPSVVRSHLMEAVPKRLRRIGESVGFANPEIIIEYERRRLLIALGAVATGAGTWYEVFRPTPGKIAILIGKPIVTLLLIAGKNGTRELALVQLDAVSRRVTMRSLSSQLLVPHHGVPRAITDVLSESDGKRSSALARIRRDMAEALNVNDLECIVAPDMHLPGGSILISTEDVWSPSLAGYVGRISAGIAMLTAFRRGHIRSTLSPWRTAGMLARLQAFTKDQALSEDRVRS